MFTILFLYFSQLGILPASSEGVSFSFWSVLVFVFFEVFFVDSCLVLSHFLLSTGGILGVISDSWIFVSISG